MLRAIQVSNTLPISFPVAPTDTFQPGNVGQLKMMGNEVVCGLSDGSAPIGLIDDVVTNAFTAPVKDEVVVISAVGTYDGYGNWVSVADSKEELRFANIVRSSFVADVSGLILNDANGTLKAPAGTTLNYDSDGDGIPDSVRTIVDYIYRLANIPGDNSTVGSGRVTIWFGRGIYETDQYDITQRYVLNSPLFVTPSPQDPAT